MSSKRIPFRRACCACGKEHRGIDGRINWLHPVCGNIICCEWQPSNTTPPSSPRSPCPDSWCLYHCDEANATKLCQWPPLLKPQGYHLPAPALGMHRFSERKVGIPPGGIDFTTHPDTTTTVLSDTFSKDGILTHPFYNVCGNCNTRYEPNSITGIDLECLIGLCSLCFGHPKGHESHARDKILRLMDSGIIHEDFNKKMADVLTRPVVKRVESAYRSSVARIVTLQQGGVGGEEGKMTEDVIGKTRKTQSFLEKMDQIRTCGFCLLYFEGELKQVYDEMLTKAGEKSQAVSVPSAPDLPPPHSPHSPPSASVVVGCGSIQADNKIRSFIRNEGKTAIDVILSQLAAMALHWLGISVTFNCIAELLNLPSTFYDALGTKGIEDDNVRIGRYQAAFKSLDISCPKSASKAVMIIRTLVGIRDIIDGDDVSLELDLDGLKVLGLKEGVDEVILACQAVCKYLESPKDVDVEAIKTNLIEKCDKVSKMMTIESIYTAMYQVFPTVVAKRHLQEGLDYMLAEGGKSYDGAKAIAAFDLAISLGSREAMFRKAQMLSDGRVGVKRDASLAVKLFEFLKNEGLYLPQIYYYLSKHALEGPIGRTDEVYKLVSEYFTKIIEMKWDDNDNESEERKGGERGDEGSKASCGKANQTAPPEGSNPEKKSMDDKKAAILFAQVGTCYIRYMILKPVRYYFFSHLPLSIRQWIKETRLLDLCIQAWQAGCKEPELYTMMGLACYNHKREDEDKKAALDNLRKACALGVPSAFHLLGSTYSPGFYEGAGFQKDAKKAMSYYLEAESTGYNGNGCLYTDIGHLYWHREDGESGGNKALEYFDRGISHEDEHAYRFKALMYQSESYPCPPIIKCDKTAHKIRLEAEMAGCKHPDIFTDLARGFVLGKGVSPDGQKALEYYEKSIKYGGMRQYQWIGLLHDSGGYPSLPNLKKDDSKALQYYLKEAEMVLDQEGHFLVPVEPWLFTKIGTLYEQGRGTPIDYHQAIHYYKKAGEKCGFSLTRLGSLYDSAYTAQPFPSKDDTEARKYYKAAYDLNRSSDKLCTDLGNMYRDGRGGDVDGEKAMACYDKAISLKGYDAMYEKALIYDPEKKSCPPFEKDEKRAVELYLAAEAFGCKSKALMLALADCFKRGRHVGKDVARAAKYTKLAQ